MEAEGSKRSAGVPSVAAVLLAFLASQHHTLHMVLIALGIGGAGASSMTMFPMVRRVMLLMSLAMVVVLVYRALDARCSNAMRLVSAVSVLVTLGLVGWSVRQFGF
ncbi:MAG: hypothetical protein K0B16_01210 [Burkholderiaceae bacterium]|nr:hypothetical protein [Burkholderiaceae bacterium]